MGMGQSILLHRRVCLFECFNYRQDSAVLLEGLVTIVSKNPNYYSPDLTACPLANLKTRIIPREELKLLEEIGEGAFGKVYKGEWWNSTQVQQKVRLPRERCIAKANVYVLN